MNQPEEQTKPVADSFAEQKLNALDQIAFITIINRAGEIISANDNFCRISGFSRSEILGKNHRIFKSETYDENFYNKIWATLDSGKTWQGQIKNKNKNGEEYWVFSNIIPIQNAKTKEYDQFIFIRYDISESKKIEEELKEEQMKTNHLYRLAALGEISSSIVHEINNPLSIIQGKLELLRRRIEMFANEDIKAMTLKNVLTIEDHAKRICKIVKGLRSFSHSDEGIVNEEVSSEQIIEAVNELCRDKIRNNSVQLRINYDEFTFKTPKIHLEQVLVNLINNSIDAIASSENKWIELSLKENEKQFIFSVTDSGFGIPAEHLDKIMTPFFTTKPPGFGTGLGLSISKGLINKMGGKLFYDKESSQTRFVFIIPKEKETEALAS